MSIPSLMEEFLNANLLKFNSIILNTLLQKTLSLQLCLSWNQQCPLGLEWES